MGNASSSANVGRDNQYGAEAPIGRSLDAPEIDDNDLPTGIVAMVEARGFWVRMAYPPESEVGGRSGALELILEDFQRNISKQNPTQRYRVRMRDGGGLLLGVTPEDRREVFATLIRVLYSYGYALESNELGVFIFALNDELLDTQSIVDNLRDGEFDREALRNAQRVVSVIESIGVDDLELLLNEIEQDDDIDIDTVSVRETLDDGDPEEVEAAQDELIDELVEAGPSAFEIAAKVLSEIVLDGENEDEDDFDLPPLFDAGLLPK